MRKVALITGGSRGIGFAIAGQLAENGFDIAINGTRKEEDVRKSYRELEEKGARVIYCRGDIGIKSDRQKIIGIVKEEFGWLNLLVNNAGVAPLQRVDAVNVTEESYERVMRINLQGPFFLTQAVARFMIEQREKDPAFSGTIINIGSISATVVSPSRAEYCISKAGFSMHSRIWAVSLAEHGISVFEVRPGVILTDMTSGVTEKYDRLIEEGLNIQPRWGTPEDVAKSVLSLALGYFPFSSGGVFMVDGGLTVKRL
jgi:3-oxoacyl-[acyl-carrier protein] reductase